MGNEYEIASEITAVCGASCVRRNDTALIASVSWLFGDQEGGSGLNWMNFGEEVSR